MPTAIVSLCISRELVDLYVATTRVAGEAVSRHQAWRVESKKDARSAGVSHSAREPTSTTTGADPRWPQSNTVVHSAVSGRVPFVAL